MASDFLRNVKNGHFGRNQKLNRTTTEVEKTTTTIVVRKTLIRDRSIKQSISRDRSELQRLCRYNRCKAIHTNGEG